MKTIKIVAALAFLALPGSACAAALDNHILANEMKANFAPPAAAENPMGSFAAEDANPLVLQPESLKVPTINQLNEEIDHNNSLIERKPLPDFKLSTSTKKIIKSLPDKLSKQKPAAKGKEALKTGDFNGAPEKVLPPARPDAPPSPNAPVNIAAKKTEKSKKGTKKPAPQEGPGNQQMGGKMGIPNQGPQGQLANQGPNQMGGQMGRGMSQPPQQEPKTFEISVAGPEKQSKQADVLALAAKAYSVGQYESAIALYKSALQTDEKNRNALFGLATSYHRNGQKAQAKIYYAKLLDKYPYDTEGQNNFLTLVGEESPQDALKELADLAKNNPDYAPIYAQKAMIYMKTGDDLNAIKNLYQAVKLRPDNVNYKYNLAVLFDKNGYYENAALLYSDLIKDSRDGKTIPADRADITDRMTFIKAKIKNSDQNNEKKS